MNQFSANPASSRFCRFHCHVETKSKGPFTPSTITIKITILASTLHQRTISFVYLSACASAALNSPARYSRMDFDWLSMFLLFISWKKSFWKWFQRYRFSVPLSLYLWCGLCYSLILRMIFRTISYRYLYSYRAWCERALTPNRSITSVGESYFWK